MNRITLRLLFVFGALFMYVHLNAQVSLVKNGKAKSKIILVDDDIKSQVAANLLQDFVQKISGCQLNIVERQIPHKGDITIGGKVPSLVTEDGFSLSTKDRILRISGSGNGTVYGVVTLLEQYLGVDYWGENEYSLTLRRQSNCRLSIK